MSTERTIGGPEVLKPNCNILIVGGGPIGFYLADRLNGYDIPDVQLIEQANVFGGSGNSSQEQWRTLQFDPGIAGLLRVQ